jgi:hypothetical protein
MLAGRIDLSTASIMKGAVTILQTCLAPMLMRI